MITGPVSLVIVNQVDAHFAFIAFTIIFCCFLSMALIFTPKIVQLVRKRGNHLSFGGSYMNGTFHNSGSSQEQTEQLKKLTSENDELQVQLYLTFFFFFICLFFFLLLILMIID